LRKFSKDRGKVQRLTLTRESIAKQALSLRGEPGDDAKLRATVAEIISRVREDGDEALIELNRKFDDPSFEAERLRVPADKIAAAAEAASEALMESLKLAAENVRLFHQHELRGDWTAPMRQSQMLGQRLIPVSRAGLYIPGGGAEYPTTVLMTAVPALVAGVGEIFICTPQVAGGEVSQAVLAAASMLGITEIYRVGGAQAVAAMAYGTATIRAADVICGPGNRYVAEAKRQVYGRVGVDNLAGPSEVLILADETAAADLIAADLLAQAEHGSGAIAVMVCWTGELMDAVAAEVAALASKLEMDEAKLDRISLVMVEDGDPQRLAVEFSNAFAPEHLQIHTEQPEQLVHEITAAGAVFLGEDVCTAYGDYIIGTNHVLPTAGTARFASALSVENFLKKVAVVSLIPDTISELTPPLIEMAQVEGLRAHALAAELRLERFGTPPVEED
jgi:histidinol dehydrogenase